MNFRTFSCKPFINQSTFEKSYRVKIYDHTGKWVFDEGTNIWPDYDDDHKIEHVNMILKYALDWPPLTQEEIFYHKLTRDNA